MNKDDRDLYIELLEKYQELLSKSQHQIMLLYYFEDLSITEIAEELAMTRSGVHDALKKGRTKLLNIYEKVK